MRRTLASIIVVLILGAIINIAVAWLIAWRYDSEWIVSRSVSSFTQVEANNIWWQGDFKRAFCTERMQIAFDDRWTGGNHISGTLEEFAAPLPWQFRSDMNEWRGTADGSKPRCLCLVIVARGWPFPALYMRRDYDRSANGFTVDGGVAIRPASARSRGGFELPLLPMWPGFALNLAVFATLVAAFWLNVRVARQWHRYRRGRCPNCARDRREDFSRGCSECGWRLQRSAGSEVSS